MPHFEFSALTLLFAQIGAILIVSRVLGVGAKAIAQPLVIAEVLAGILLGPSLLGWVWPEAMATLFPPTSLPGLQMLAQVGLVLFMFLVGLELDPRLLKGQARTSVLVSNSSIIVPFALGFVAALWVHEGYAPKGVPVTAFALFMGAAMSVTAFPVLARILSERQLTTTRVGSIAIACAAVGDVTAWCILAFVVSVAKAQDPTAAVWTTALALAFIGTMLWLVRPFLARLGERVASRAGLTPTVMSVILLLLMTSAAITELIGIHALFGAFLFGAILPKEGRLAHALAEKIETIAVVLLLPLFFAFSGLRTQIGLVNTEQDWWVAGGLVFIATLGKFGGSTLAARVTGLDWRESSAIGILMNTRGLMELIVLNIGLDLGVITPTIFTMMVVMALVTTFATTPILRLVYSDAELAGAGAPIDARGRLATGYTILACLTDGTIAPAMATLASHLRGKTATASRLYGLHLWGSSDRLSVELNREQDDPDTNPLVPLVEAGSELGLEIEPMSFVSADPGADICRTARNKQANLVLLGSHKPLLLEGRHGGVVGDVIDESSCPVAVLIDRGLVKLEHVLIAYAGGAEDLEALKLAQRIGQSRGTQLTMLHVVPPGSASRPGPGRDQLAGALGGKIGVDRQEIPQPDLDSGMLVFRIVEHADPPEAVLEEAAAGYDLIVIGMNASWGMGGGPMSLKRQRVLAESPVSVLTVHPARGEARA
jgi:Kef-type K+ transport system membrane component KefB/nucleotide-binding universal stress UspA family protein